MPPVVLTEAQIMIIYCFRIDIVRYNRVKSENSSRIWKELRCEHFNKENEIIFHKLMENTPNEMFCELIM